MKSYQLHLVQAQNLADSDNKIKWAENFLQAIVDLTYPEYFLWSDEATFYCKQVQCYYLGHRTLMCVH